MAELHTPILIVGGGCGAVAAALAIARTGGSCILTEYTDWIGGQLTSQAVPPDENRWIEGEDGFFGATGSYIDFRNRVRAYYRQHRQLTEQARSNPRLNPGNGWVSHLCMEPRIVHEVLLQMLAPHVAAGAIKVLLNVEPISAQSDHDRVKSVTFRHLDSSNTTTIAADYFLDATELGDLYPLAGVEYNVGAEAQSVFGEMHARKDKSDPTEFQAISWCFAIEHRPGENHVITKPANYDFWRNYHPNFDIPWPGKLLSWTVLGGGNHEAREFRFMPWPQQPPENELEMWRYRRIVDRSLYDNPIAANHPDVALINMVQMDYFLKPVINVTPQAKQQAFNEAREQSLSFLYWMQTEAPRFDGTDGVGYPGLRLRGDELGTTDGFAKFPYIREARRLKARTIVTEADIGTDQRRAEGKPDQHLKPWGVAEAFPDSVGIGHYRLDLHPSTAMRNSIYVQSAPFRIPLGSLIPARVKNVLAAAKNQGVTHITNGCYRMHPTEWNTGESAGLLAQHCLATKREPAQVHENIERVRDFQKLVISQGVVISWPWENGAGLA